MHMLGRLRRKIQEVRLYPPLGQDPGDRRQLLALGLVRNRVPGSGFVARLVVGAGRVITPRLLLSGGERIRLQLDHSGQIDVFDELFLGKIYDLAAVPFSPDLVVDCGAYCGYFSAMASGAFRGARIVCFEANPSNLPMIQAQLALLDGKVELQPVAAHIRDGTAEFSGSGTGGSLASGGNQPDSVRVRCIDFPTWLREQAPERLVLKLDVEGAERELLPAVLDCLPPRTICYLETHYPDGVCETLLAPYRAVGFDVRLVRRRPAQEGNFSYIEWLLKRNN
jgi:FkbM family methyltransferase